jgi:hypothetical protein
MDPAEPIDEAHQAHRHAAAITAYRIRAAVSSRCRATVSTVCREALPPRAHRGHCQVVRHRCGGEPPRTLDLRHCWICLSVPPLGCRLTSATAARELASHAPPPRWLPACGERASATAVGGARPEHATATAALLAPRSEFGRLPQSWAGPATSSPSHSIHPPTSLLPTSAAAGKVSHACGSAATWDTRACNPASTARRER